MSFKLHAHYTHKKSHSYTHSHTHIHIHRALKWNIETNPCPEHSERQKAVENICIQAQMYTSINKRVCAHKIYQVMKCWNQCNIETVRRKSTHTKKNPFVLKISPVALHLPVRGSREVHECFLFPFIFLPAVAAKLWTVTSVMKSFPSH